MIRYFDFISFKKKRKNIPVVSYKKRNYIISNKKCQIKKFRNEMKLFLIIALVSLFMSCAARQQKQPAVVVADGIYDSEFPQKAVSTYLKKMSSTIRLISSLTFYHEYYFRSDEEMTVTKLKKNPELLKQAASAIVEKPASGTATIIAVKQRKALLLTCAHTIREPDTLVHYFPKEHSKPGNYIRSISIKIRQSMHVVGIPGSGQLTVVAADSILDLALVQRNIPINLTHPLPVFTYPLGKSAELNWGSFVYLFGFPHGKKVVSNAIVSHPNRNPAHDFIINATMYQGVSGGPIIALRDGPPHFELVGIANALPILQHLVVRPDPDTEITSSTFGQPYRGSVFIERQNEIIQGMTFAISAESIRLFFKKNQNLLEAMDVTPNDFAFLKPGNTPND